nr:MAG TPA: hypothetical protein [Caudoviricetes sp.]
MKQTKYIRFQIVTDIFKCLIGVNRMLLIVSL